MSLKVAISTLGCKVNQYESSCIVNDFLQAGFTAVSFEEEADVYIINTCTVTGRTDFKSRNQIRHALQKKEINPEVKIVVTGCYSQLNREKIAQMGDIDCIIDNNDKNAVLRALEESKMVFTDNALDFDDYCEQQTSAMLERVRAYIKIEDGCDYFCSYCTIPYARGKPRSRTAENVIKQINTLTEKGYREFIITGINLGLYGRDFKPQVKLSDLLTQIEKLEGVKKIRLSSIEPQLIDDDILHYIKQSEKLCPHFHIPMQNGSDEILKQMNRTYSSKDYADLIHSILKIKSDAAIGSDIIIGFPGETEAHFNATYDFVASLPLAYAHIFPYSKRKGTKADLMSQQIASDIVKQRTKKLSELMTTKKDEYITQLIANNTLLSGVLEKKSGNYWTALSDHYIRIYTKDKLATYGDIITKQAIKKKGAGIEVAGEDES